MKKIGFIVMACCVTLITSEVPSYMKICGRRNPNLDQCVLDSVTALRPKLKSGMKELDVPKMEPLYVDKVALLDLPNFKAVATNVTLFGLADFTVTNLHLDLEKMRIDLEVFFKSIRLTADYDVNAKILVPIMGRGPIELVSYNVNANCIIKFKKTMHKGKQYLFFPTMTTKLTIEDYTANFTPKSGPESPLATAINAALAENKREFIDGTIPNVERTVSEKVLIISNKICKHFTYEELFPDRE